MSVGEDEVTFNYGTGLFYCYGENMDVSDEECISNGTGKTVILVDALLFVLFGKTQRNIKKAQIVNLHAKGKCSVKVSFKKNEDIYEIERTLKPDDINIIKNGEPLSTESAKRKSNSYIVDNILDGLSFDVFRNLIVLNGTSSKHFFEYGKNEKRNFINEVFKLGFLDFLQTDTTNELKEMKSELDRREVLLTSKLEEIKRMQGIKDSQEGGELISMAEEIEVKLKEEEAKLANCEQRLMMIVEATPDIDSEEERIQTAKSKIQEFNNEIVKINHQLQTYRKEYTECKRKYTETMNRDSCPTCTQDIPMHVKQPILETIKTQADSVVNSANEEKVKLEKYTEQLNKMQKWLESAKSKKREAESLMNECNTSRRFIETYKTQIKNNEKDSSKHNTKVIEEEIIKMETEHETLKKDFIEYQNEYNHVNFTRKILSNENFYGYYISIFRKYLNKFINEYLEKMSSPHRIEFNNSLDANVYDSDVEVHSYDNLSTGEKSKINLALLLSFFDVLHMYYRLQTNILVLDEVLDSGLDSHSIDMLHNILSDKSENSEGLGIYVVSHKSSDSNYAEQQGVNKIVFEKIGGFTKVKEN